VECVSEGVDVHVEGFSGIRRIAPLDSLPFPLSGVGLAGG
jgi:hypothetical protein